MHAPSHSAAAAPLRLVNTDVALLPRARRVVIDQPARRPSSPTVATATTSIGLDVQDPRWLLARRAFEQIQGGRAAVLPPESRERLNALGARLGLRAFDTSLVIAIVQDHVRSGDGGEATTQTLLRRLSMIPAPVSGSPGDPAARPSLLPWAVAAAAMAVGMIALAANWLTT